MRKERYSVEKISVGAQRKNDVATLRKKSLCAARETRGADSRDFDKKVWGFKVDQNDRLFNLSRVKCLTFSKKCGIISKKNIFSPKAKSIDKRAKMWYNKNRKQ